jgi:hypothetical protein
VELNGREDTAVPWSIRQMIVYHQWDKKNKNSTWFMVSPSIAAENIMERQLQAEHIQPRTDPFELHTALIKLALCNWRWYLEYLTDRITRQVCYK